MSDKITVDENGNVHGLDVIIFIERVYDYETHEMTSETNPGRYFAVFPELESTLNPNEMTCYAKVGQHHSGTWAGIVESGQIIPVKEIERAMNINSERFDHYPVSVDENFREPDGTINYAPKPTWENTRPTSDDRLKAFVEELNRIGYLDLHFVDSVSREMLAEYRQTRLQGIMTDFD